MNASRSVDGNVPRLSRSIEPRRAWRLRRAWHASMKPIWRSARPFVVIAAAAAVLVLGTVGFHDKLGLGFLDSLYNAVQLFGFGGKVPNSPPWQLEIARFLGPILVGYAAIRGLLVIFREQMQLLWFRLVLRGHVVVAGLGDVGYFLVEQFNDVGAKVVAIEKDPTNPRIAACRDRGIGVLVGDAADRISLTRAQVRRASYMVVSCGPDQEDMEVAMGVRDEVQGRRGVLTLFVNLGEPTLWRSIRSRALAEPVRDSLRLEPFNLLDSAASLMVEVAHPFARESQQPVVLIAGNGAIAEALALQAARVWLNTATPSDAKLRIQMIGSSARRDRKSLLGRHPELANVGEVVATDLDVESHELVLQAEEATAIFVAYPDEARGLASALTLQSGTRREGVPVWLAVRREDSGVATAASAAGIKVFGIFTRALGGEFLNRGMNEVMARAQHEEYRHVQISRGGTMETNRSLIPWEELPESLRESNRRAVDGIGPKLREIRAGLTPAPLIQADGRGGFEFTPEEVELLAVLEHERWSQDLREEGWRPTNGRKDPAGKRHPSLVSWTQLTPEEKQKDRDSVLAIPEVLARAGYAIERLS